MNGVVLKGRLRGQPRNRAGRVASGTIWPDGTWSLGFAKTAPDDDRPWQQPGAIAVGRQNRGIGEWDRPAVPLDLRNVSNSHKPPTCPLKPRGSKGMTGLGRKMIRGAGALLTRHPSFGASTFATITIPTLSKSQRCRLVEVWPEYVRQLLQQVSRQLARQGLPPIVLSVTEVQTKRLEEYGQAYPHLHLLWPNRKGARKGSWAVDVQKLREWAHRALCRLLDYPELGHVNIDVKPVRRSVAAYMSKYMTKGEESVSKARKDWGGYTVKQWWNLTATARKWVLANKYSGYKTGILLETALHEAWETNNFMPFIWLRHVEIPYNSGIVTVGWRGCLTDAARRDLTAMLKSD